MSARLLGIGWAAEVPTQSHLLVLLKLVDCCDDDGRHIFPYVANVAKAAKCSHRHAQRVIAEFRRIGLLRLIKPGGRGQESPAHYEMDVNLLARLRRAELYPALLAAAAVDPLTDDDGESHAQDACDGDDGGTDSTPSKGDRVSPLETSRVTPEAAKGDSWSHPHITPQRTLTSEREGALTQAGTPASTGDAHDAEHAPDAEPDGRPPATLDDFRKAYPHAGADEQGPLATAWNGLPFAERWPAIDGIPAFLAERKAAGFDKRLSAPKYLAGRNWKLVPKQAAERAAAQAAGASQIIQPWSRDWWLALLGRIASKQPIKFMVQRADEGKVWTETTGFMAEAAKRIGELKPYLCSGPEIDAWRPWLAAKGARIPVFEGNFRVFLPGPYPPGGRQEEGDQDVRF